jgi:leucyl-tRNA synthetase
MMADESAMVRTTVSLVVQINGKVRANVDVPADITEPDATALAVDHPNCQKYFEDKTVRKVIFVPGKLINFVVN